MKKVLMINGSPNEFGCTYTALNEVKSELLKNGVSSDIIYLGKKPIAGCIACGECRKTGKCVFNDKVNELLEKLAAGEYGAIVVGSPVYFAGPSGQLCSFLERLFYCRGTKLNGMLAASVVSCRRGGASASFDRLNKFFSISKMHIVGSQYWNSVHGYTPEDVMQDKEGLQTMRTLGLNIAWLLKNLEAGKNAGIELPEYEKVQVTNFI